MSSTANVSHFWPLVTTITLTDFVIVIDERITTTPAPFSDDRTSPATIGISSSEDHDGIPRQLFPFLGVFAIIGLMTVVLVLGFLGYRFYRSDQRLDDRNGRRSGDGSNSTTTIDGRPRKEAAVPWTEAYKVKSPILTRFIRKWEHRVQEPPISPTFVPMPTSPMTLVPRWEVWRDPQRRRGIDALDLWEKKNAHGDRSISSSSETIQSLQENPESSTHVAMARQALEKTRTEN